MVTKSLNISVARRRIRYDNLKPAVIRCFGRRAWRTNVHRFSVTTGLTEASIALWNRRRSRKGREFEGEIGRFRRNHLTVPVFGSLASRTSTSLRATPKTAIATLGLARQRSAKTSPANKRFCRCHRDELRPDAPPVKRYRLQSPCGYRFARTVSLVPALPTSAWSVRLGADSVVVFEWHDRSCPSRAQFASRRRDLPELITTSEVLQRKPGALVGSTALVQARQIRLVHSGHIR